MPERYRCAVTWHVSTAARSGWVQLSRDGRWLLYLAWPPWETSRAACVLAEAERDRIVFTAFDPLKGRIGLVATAVGEPTFRALSPDGGRIAIGAPVRVISPGGFAQQPGRETAGRC